MMKSPRIQNILLILLAIAVCWALVCTRTAGVIPVWSTLRRLSPYLLAFAACHTYFSSGDEKAWKVLFVLFCCYALAECGLGTAQLAGWTRSRHEHYQLTGNFINPAPYACLLGVAAICCLVRLLRRDCGKALKILSATTLVWSLAMVVIAQSRAVWLGTVLAAIVALARESNNWARIRHKKLLVCCGVLLFLAGCFGVWMIKPESAQARLYIWQIDCLAIEDHPLMGAGPGTEMGAYGDAQSDYFKRHVRSWERQQAADIPDKPFNEFLRMGMACGIPGLLLAIAIFAISLTIEIRERRLLAYPLIVLGTFALFSFPLCQLALSMILTVTLADAVIAGKYGTKHPPIYYTLAVMVMSVSIPFCKEESDHRSELKGCIKTVKAQTLDSKELAAYFEHLGDEPEYLKYYAKSLYDESRYDEALAVVRRLERMTADPAVPIIRGEICRMTGDAPGAAEALIKSYYSAPSRLTALFFLMTLYQSYGLNREAAATREYALSLPVDEKYTATMEMRQQIEDYPLTTQ